MIEVDLGKALLEGKDFDKLEIERTEHDWIACRVEESKFRGFGGPENLGELLTVFLDWAEANKNDNA